MKPSAYYNEIDPYAAQWLSNLIAAGHIAPGDVDTRSITDVCPDDIRHYTQCHFFAGIGVWSYALRLAGWSDDRPVWTGSCPCQPFSAAGKGDGFADDRHLYPAWANLIRECHPARIYGEQVEAAIKHGWIDLVQHDLEANGYAFGKICLPAASVGAPHIRSRLWFVADSVCKRLEGYSRDGADRNESGRIDKIKTGSVAETGAIGWMANTMREQTHTTHESRLYTSASGSSDACKLANTNSTGCSPWSETTTTTGHGYPIGSDGRDDRNKRTDALDEQWRSADWLFCRDGKWRPVEPGTFPLADGVTSRVGRLRAYGNAIVPQVAAEIIKATM